MVEIAPSVDGDVSKFIVIIMNVGKEMKVRKVKRYGRKGARAKYTEGIVSR